MGDVRGRVLTRFRLGLKTKAPIGAGSFTKDVILLVGERTSHPEENKYHAPFCSTKGCSGWLNKKLDEAEIPEDKLFWVNALDNDGSEVDLRKLYDALEPRAVIALGNVAQKQLKKFEIKHELVPHPQYWKRFKHHEPYPLITLLTGVIT
jgi:hypothetical protein